MARTTGPLLSMDASGSVAGTITFAKWKGRNYVRQLVVPANPQSPLQVGMRASMKFLTQFWASGLTSGNKATWDALAASQAISSFNAYVQYNQARARAGLGYSPVYPAVVAAGEAAPTAGAAAAAYKSLAVTWVDSAGADDSATYVYQSVTTGFTPGVDSLVAIIPHGVQKYTAPRLTSGVPYYYRLAGVDKAGNLGTLEAQFTGTPT